MTAEVLCLVCSRELHFDPTRGWCHPAGGPAWFSCRCSWEGARPLFPETRPMCPACGGTDRIEIGHLSAPNLGGAA